MFFWHIGATTGFIRYAFRDPAMDLRFLALGAILPDLVDLPIAIALWGTYQAPRLGAHSLAFGAALMVLVLLITRRGPRRKRWLLLAVGVLLHLFLDAMWQQPETLWWPLLGFEFSATTFATYGDYVADLVRNPVMWLGEAAGLLYLVMLARRAKISEPSHRHTLLREGTVSASIDRT